MIYLKRFCFCIVSILCVLIGVLGTIIELITYPIRGIIGYVITGRDLMDYLMPSFIFEYSMKFLNWYKNKFGPNDD